MYTFLLHLNDESNVCLEPTRKHDLESLFYTMIYLLKSECAYGNLEQSFASTKLKMKHQLMKREKFINLAKKNEVTLAEYLTTALEVPQEFINFGNHIFSLSYDEEPDYDYLYEMLDS